MTDDHWFDRLNMALVRENSRRPLLGTVALLASLGFVAPLSVAAKNGNRKGKRKHKRKGKGPVKGRENDKKDKGPPQPCGPDIHAACESAFSLAHHTPQDVQSCKDRCAQCKAEGTAFCIIEREERAACCDDADVCCGDGVFGDCCSPDRCCAREGGGGSFCAPPGEHCCRDGTGGSCRHGAVCCENGTCLTCEALLVPNQATCQCECFDGTMPPCGCADNCVGPTLACCDGECVNIAFGDEEHCGGCNQPCLFPGLECCAGRCIDPLSDQEFCGGCFAPSCGGGRLCCDGDCKDIDNDEENCGGCGQTCVGPDLRCCDGNCVNTRIDPEKCGRCGRGGPEFGCCGGNPYRPDEQYCCPDELRACYNQQVCCFRDDGTPACCPRP